MQLTLKERKRTFRFLLLTVSYEEHLWNICADLTVLTMLTVLQGGYTKFCCF